MENRQNDYITLHFSYFCVYCVLSILLEIGEVEHGVVVHGCGLDEVSPLGLHNLLFWIIFISFVTSFILITFNTIVYTLFSGASTVFELKNIAAPGQPKQYETKT